MLYKGYTTVCAYSPLLRYSMHESQPGFRAVSATAFVEKEELTPFHHEVYRGSSLAKTCTPLGPCGRPMPRVLRGS